MRVLVACEFSGIVRDAFIAKGHDAWSCDLLPTERPGPHIQADFLKVRFLVSWDMIIAFPPCTHLSNACATLWPKKRETGEQQAAIQFIREIDNSASLVAIENPVGVLSSVYRKPEQIIQPFQFGDPERKTTCLWLKGLPKLTPTNIVEAKPKKTYIRKSGAKAGKKYHAYYHQGKTAKDRSRTFQGIANAMAEQWS